MRTDALISPMRSARLLCRFRKLAPAVPHKLLVSENKLSHRLEADMNITQGLRRALQINPHGIAILEGERQIEWAELGERVSRFAGALRKNGVGKGDRVRGPDAEF